MNVQNDSWKFLSLPLLATQFIQLISQNKQIFDFQEELLKDLRAMNVKRYKFSIQSYSKPVQKRGKPGVKKGEKYSRHQIKITFQAGLQSSFHKHFSGVLPLPPKNSRHTSKKLKRTKKLVVVFVKKC